MKINDIFDKITMIVCVLVTMVLISAPGWTTTYYVSNTGSDSSSGTSTGSPWKTVSKVNSRSFSPGDNILFERGDQWMEQLNNSSDGTSGNYITYGAYGTGNKPVIDLNTPGLANAIYNGSNSWIIYENFEIIGDRDRNSNSYCVTFTSGANNCIVRSCTIRDHGSISGGMYGDGVQI